MIKKTSVFILLSILLSVTGTTCDCGVLSIKEGLEHSDFIILGEVLEIYDSLYTKTKLPQLSSDYPSEMGYWVKVRIINRLKGKQKCESIVITPDWSNCDYLFEREKKYFIFGYFDKNGDYKTNVCTSTFSENEKEKKKKLLSLIQD